MDIFPVATIEYPILDYIPISDRNSIRTLRVHMSWVRTSKHHSFHNIQSGMVELTNCLGQSVKSCMSLENSAIEIINEGNAHFTMYLETV